MSDEHARRTTQADGMPDKRLMYDSSVAECETDDEGVPVEVTIVERWGKSNRRARLRELDPERREYVSGGGYTCKVHGAVVVDGEVFEVIEKSDRERWWLRPVKWGEGP